MICIRGLAHTLALLFVDMDTTPPALTAGGTTPRASMSLALPLQQSIPITVPEDCDPYFGIRPNRIFSLCAQKMVPLDE